MDVKQAKVIMSGYGIFPNKRFGQHFLVKDTAAEDIVHLLEVVKTSHVIEIGPGIGALTEKLLDQCAKITVIEIDQALCNVLQALYVNNERISILCQDALQTDYTSFMYESSEKNINNLRVISNLPYYISTAMLTKLVTELNGCPVMVFTVQKEIAEKLTALPGTSQYTALSVFVQSYYRVRNALLLSAGNFYPSPKVSSSAVQLLWRSETGALTLPLSFYHSVLSASFSHRRKTLQNALGESGLIKGGKSQLGKLLKDENLPSMIRAQELSADQFIKLSKKILLL